MVKLDLFIPLKDFSEWSQEVSWTIPWTWSILLERQEGRYQTLQDSNRQNEQVLLFFPLLFLFLFHLFPFTLEVRFLSGIFFSWTTVELEPVGRRSWHFFFFISSDLTDYVVDNVVHFLLLFRVGKKFIRSFSFPYWNFGPKFKVTNTLSVVTGWSKIA